jgi:hypothetical protein
MTRRYDHIDLRVPRLAEAAPFYEALLPALGFTRRVRVEGWLQYEAAAGMQPSFSVSPNLQTMWPMKTGLPFGLKATVRLTIWHRQPRRLAH